MLDERLCVLPFVIPVGLSHQASLNIKHLSRTGQERRLFAHGHLTIKMIVLEYNTLRSNLSKLSLIFSMVFSVFLDRLFTMDHVVKISGNLNLRRFAIV